MKKVIYELNLIVCFVFSFIFTAALLITIGAALFIPTDKADVQVFTNARLGYSLVFTGIVALVSAIISKLMEEESKK